MDGKMIDRFGFILLNMFADIGFASQALGVIKEDMLDTESEYCYRLILRAVRSIVDAGSESISEPGLVVMIHLEAEQSSDFDINDRDEAISVVNDLFGVAKGFRPDVRHATSELRNFATTRGVQRGLLKSISGSTGDSFIRVMEEVSEKLNTIKAATTASVEDDNYFDPATSANIKRHVIVPTGVSAIDSLLGGGPAHSDSIGILGFPAGGKTLLGVQLTAETARQRKHAAYFMYENDPEDGGLLVRFKGYAAGIPASVFHHAEINHTDIPDECKDRIRAESRVWMQEFLHVRNCAKPGTGSDGMSGVKAYLSKMDREGQHIDLLVIDQLLPMVSKYMAANNVPVESRRAFMQGFMLDLTATADAHKCVAIVLHQIDNESKKKPVTMRPTMGLASEDKSFDNWLVHSLVLWQRDMNNRGYLSLVKSRRFEHRDIVVQHEPNMWRVRYDSAIKYVASGKDAFVTSSDALEI